MDHFLTVASPALIRRIGERLSAARADVRRIPSAPVRELARAQYGGRPFLVTELRGFFRENQPEVLLPLLVLDLRLQFQKRRKIIDDDRFGTRRESFDLRLPFADEMGRAHDDDILAEPVIHVRHDRADAHRRLAASALADDEGSLLVVERVARRLDDGLLRIIELQMPMILRIIRQIVQHLAVRILSRREARDKCPLDALRQNVRERVEICVNARHMLHIIRRMRRPVDGNRAAPQTG